MPLVSLYDYEAAAKRKLSIPAWEYFNDGSPWPIPTLKPLRPAELRSGAIIAPELAAAQPNLVQTLTLIEPAACGPFQASAFAEIGQRFVGPAIGNFAAGDIPSAFDSFMLGVCGQNYRYVMKTALGDNSYSQTVAESKYFFQEEVPAAMQWQFSAEQATKVRQPVLVVEGAAGREEGPLSQQVTELTVKLLPQSEVLLIEGSNHATAARSRGIQALLAPPTVSFPPVMCKDSSVSCFRTRVFRIGG